MIAFTNAKINLGLHVGERRTDGYHNIETVFYPIPFYDVVEFIESDQFKFHTSGLSCGNPDENLCTRAYQILKKNYSGIPPIHMHLHKAIPSGAGLGGGSSDAVSVLQLLNKGFSLGIEEAQLINFALQLGSDCPFFLLNKPCLAHGRGEETEEISLSLNGYHLLLITPAITISTKEIFDTFQSVPASPSLKEIIRLAVPQWKQNLKNDFEPIVFNRFPELKRLKDTLYGMGALYAAMTGTGSSIYGIFENKLTMAGNFKYHHRWMELS